MTSYNNKAITYNANGGVTSYNGWNYTWNKGKLSSITTKSNARALKPTLSPSKTYSFTYNALGQRTTSNYSYFWVDNGLTPITQGEVTNYSKTFYYDHSGRLISETISKTLHGVGEESESIVFLYDESSMVGFTYSKNGATPTSYYYQRNLLGDVIGIYNTSGTKVVEYAYDAYGNCTIKSSTTNYDLAHANPIRYRGYYYDENTKLYYLNARYYSPELRRFISPDDTSYLNPENVNGLNLYCYCYNDPINYCDPTGNLPHWLEWLIGGAVIGLTALGAIFLPGAMGVIAGAAFYGAVTSAVGGAVLGGIIGGITGGWEGILNGAANGFMWGAISGAVSAALTSGINIATGQLKIVGSAQKTGSLFHQFASNVQAGKMSLAVGQYSEIHLNRSKGLNIKGFRPDVTGVTKNGLKVVEVVSTSQTYASQVAKIGRMMGKHSHITNGLTLDEWHLITSWFVF